MAHRRIVVVAWLVATIGIFAVSSSLGKKTASSFTLPGTGSQHAVDLLKSRFPAQAGQLHVRIFVGWDQRACERRPTIPYFCHTGAASVSGIGKGGAEGV